MYEEQGRALPARSGTAEIGELADELSVLLLSHLAYEEDELVGGLARMPGPIWVGAAEGQALDRSRIAAGPDDRVRHDRCGLPGVRTGQLLDASAERRHRIPASMKASMSPSNTAPGLPTS